MSNNLTISNNYSTSYFDKSFNNNHIVNTNFSILFHSQKDLLLIEIIHDSENIDIPTILYYTFSKSYINTLFTPPYFNKTSLEIFNFIQITHNLTYNDFNKFFEDHKYLSYINDL